MLGGWRWAAAGPIFKFGLVTVTRAVPARAGGPSDSEPAGLVAAATQRADVARVLCRSVRQLELELELESRIHYHLEALMFHWQVTQVVLFS